MMRVCGHACVLCICFVAGLVRDAGSGLMMSSTLDSMTAVRLQATTVTLTLWITPVHGRRRRRTEAKVDRR